MEHVLVLCFFAARHRLHDDVGMNDHRFHERDFKRKAFFNKQHHHKIVSDQSLAMLNRESAKRESARVSTSQRSVNQHESA